MLILGGGKPVIALFSTDWFTTDVSLVSLMFEARGVGPADVGM